ncbi:oxygen-insensitive NAD(P)H nitroreductase [Amphritea sp. 1_MG-2023]|jgi:nitroreductase/dihydropteridine reductase|uniref:oxygen-insensitive NAD(P)H nitroreductase n=1 Tax=Amphritea sp. 1_MG-2023 TaxID=3062670 RepID=UPI0026E14299|nr:oxygen-insensitive NAD(P)H nitroreductase [Amphritea sp. 1_MG-2023]MDO6561788.1 oxygen-insensitive NAD(P)H nitroreductase [Amphritea sp. 1_MG-2023]MDX2423777.1 oxygen-insensitive NAD(P)H nitroreductase [Amphritea sp.]
MNLTDIVKSRYSTKEFDSNKAIPEAQFQQIKDVLRYSPSSVNSQPWHFIIADSPETRKRISAGTQGAFSFNEAKVLNASHVILFCAKTDIDDAYLQHLLTVEDNDGRFAEPSFKEGVNNGRSMFVNLHRFELKDAQHWMEKQVYLNMGTVLLGAGALGIDAVPIEGIDTKALNEEFGLLEKGYTALALIALGYHSQADFNAGLPKSRLPEDEIFTLLS